MPNGPFTEFEVLTPSGFARQLVQVEMVHPDHPEPDAARAMLGIPSGVMRVKLWLDAHLGWQGYTYRLIGTFDDTTTPPEAIRMKLRR